MAVVSEIDRHERRGREKPDPLETHVATFVRSQRMLAMDDRILVAVSGGPDSVALLSLLTRWRQVWRLDIHAVHFDHGLRGTESAEDARFVEALCTKFEIPLEVERLLLTGVTGSRQPESLQARARDARYAALERMKRRMHAQRIAVGHTADDQAETVMMWLLRGAGATGLSGIPPTRDSGVIRPLLQTSRAEILAYLARRELDSRFDSSNASDRYLRNRIRRHLMPVLTRFNPNIVRVLARQADLVRDDDRYLDHLTRRWEAEQLHVDEDEIVFSRSRFQELPVALQRRVVRNVVRRVSRTSQGPPRSFVERILREIIDGSSGNVGAMEGALVKRDYDRIHVVGSESGRPSAQQEEAQEPLALSIPSTVVWAPTGERIHVSIQEGRESHGHRGMAVLDADRVSDPLLVRSWRPGDRFCPLGMGGHRKKLQDFFSDLKVPRAMRKRIPVIVAPEGILWVGGYRSDHRFRVRPTTRRMLVIQLLPRVV